MSQSDAEEAQQSPAWECTDQLREGQEEGSHVANPAPMLELLRPFLPLAPGSRGGSCRTETWRRREDWSRTRHEMGIGDGGKGLRGTGCKLETGLGQAEY